MSDLRTAIAQRAAESGRTFEQQAAYERMRSVDAVTEQQRAGILAKGSDMSYAEARRDQYLAEEATANDYYRETRDLPGYQRRHREAVESWHADIRAHYYDRAVEDAYTDASVQGGRVYGTLKNGQVVRVYSLASLYDVSATVGAPAEPLIARLTTLTAKHTTVADLIHRA